MKIALLGTWHVHAGGYLKTAKNFGEIVGVYEENTEWKHAFAERHEVPEFETFEDLLNSDADAVIVCTSTNKHTDYIVELANHKKDIFTEKVLAFTVEDCLKIKEAIEKNGVRFVISFPQKKFAGHVELKKIQESGELGEINYVRFRNCHNGSVDHWLPAHFYNKEQCGGGAMIDLGAHGMYLTHWFLGEPVAYASAFTHSCRDEKDAKLNPDVVEDNAVTVMTYANGAIAVNETGFVSVGAPCILEIGGSTGYATYCQNTNVLHVESKTRNEDVKLGDNEDSPLVSFLKGEKAEGCSIDEAIALTKMMIGAYSKIM